jgi:hypothetical protein
VLRLKVQERQSEHALVLEKTQGIALNITFNDDQDGNDGFWRAKQIETIEDFIKAVSIRILHRLVQSGLGDKYTIDEVDDVLSDLADSFKGSTIPKTLQLVRRVLGAPENTKILLAVDEIALSAYRKAKFVRITRQSGYIGETNG